MTPIVSFIVGCVVGVIIGILLVIAIIYWFSELERLELETRCNTKKTGENK